MAILALELTHATNRSRLALLVVMHRLRKNAQQVSRFRGAAVRARSCTVPTGSRREHLVHIVMPFVFEQCHHVELAVPLYVLCI